VGSGAMGLNLVFSLLFVPLFQRIGWISFGGLALANSLATLMEMGVAMFLLRRRLEGLGGSPLLSCVAQAAGGSALMAMGVYAWVALMAAQPAWLVASGGVVVGTGLYALAMLALRVPETTTLVQMLRRRIQK